MIRKFDTTTQEILLELEKTQKEFWNISRTTAEFLYNFIVDAKSQSVVEVGTSNGYSGIWIGKALKQTGGKLTTIEFYDKRLNIAKENFEKCGVADIITPCPPINGLNFLPIPAVFRKLMLIWNPSTP